MSDLMKLVYGLLILAVLQPVYAIKSHRVEVEGGSMAPYYTAIKSGENGLSIWVDSV